MSNPWNIDEPFIDMFTDCISVKSQHINACVFPIIEAELMSDEDYDTSIKSYSILIMKECLGNIKLNVGDKIQLENGSKLKVISCDDEQNWFKVIGRTK